MPGSIIHTKLYLPRRRDATVPRPRLSEPLRRGFHARLTLVSASAGFGKTTLLTTWLEAQASPDHVTAWLSLDQTDNDPTTFWTYVIAALQAVAPADESGLLALIEAGQARRTFLTGLTAGAWRG